MGETPYYLDKNLITQTVTFFAKRSKLKLMNMGYLNQNYIELPLFR